MLKTTHIIICMLFAVISGFASQKLVLESKSATALNKITLYPDSTFLKHSNIFFEEGTLFELIDESELEHEDVDQNQKFKWYKVKSSTGKIGWVFGDGLAVIVPDDYLEENFETFHKQKINLDSGFEDALMWMAYIEGRDNLYEKDYMNPIYNEYYLVITNKMGRSVHINVSGINARGKIELTDLDLTDITNDAIPEIIIETATYVNGSDLVNKNFEIYTIQSGNIVKALEERLTLTYSDDLKSPALYKEIEIDQGLIRVEYVDYIKCEDYQQNISSQVIGKRMERCLEYVTYAYLWDNRKKEFEPLYEETRTSVSALSAYETHLKEHPSVSSNNLSRVYRNEPLKIVKHFEKIIRNNGQKKIENYLLVQSSSGKMGYLPANYVQFHAHFHAPILNEYYKKSPVNKNEWYEAREFVQVRRGD